MYRIETRDYGYKLTFAGSIKADEMKAWVQESKTILAAGSRKFGVLVDMRELKPLIDDARLFMREGQKLYKRTGMVRSSVAVNSPIIKQQFQRIAMETGIYEWERYIDASSVATWERVGLDWIEHAVDPDEIIAA
jgi:hypothetical protein